MFLHAMYERKVMQVALDLCTADYVCENPGPGESGL
jgi:hypothetical protein